MKHPDKPQGRYSVRSKVWIEDAEGNVVLGPGRYRILEAVRRLGSLQAAAKELRMSYKALWARISATEARLGRALLDKDRSGSRLTSTAEELLQRYVRLDQNVAEECDELFDALMREALEEGGRDGGKEGG
ncbi:MAG: LysR family transcriptional regulator [Desulfohalobiaceae bacterium]|nr:LysR family transcriptional regulator [Desulfohalobiaceae bacterium]